MNKTAGPSRIVIIAGPNGAGKTTFAQGYLPRETGFPDFINVDLIAQGGHNVPAEVVRRRFDAGLRNFQSIYCKIVDSWEFYDNSARPTRLIAVGNNT